MGLKGKRMKLGGKEMLRLTSSPREVKPLQLPCRPEQVLSQQLRGGWRRSRQKRRKVISAEERETRGSSSNPVLLNLKVLWMPGK